MSSTTTETPSDNRYFGMCPHCGGNDGLLHIEREEWCWCDKCKVRWCAGSNILSTWRYQTEADWEQNRQRLADYTTVEPRMFTAEEEREWLDSRPKVEPPEDDGLPWL